MGHTVNPDGSLVLDDNVDPVSDWQAIVDLAMKLGGVRKLTSGERTSLTASQTRVGWLLVETDTNRIYLRTAQEPQGVLVHSPPVAATNVTVFGGGFGPYLGSGWSGIKYWKRNGIVYVNGAIQKDPNGSAPAQTPAANLPEGFRPPVLWQAGGNAQITAGGNIITQVEVAPNGAISISATYPDPA